MPKSVRDCFVLLVASIWLGMERYAGRHLRSPLPATEDL